MPGAPDLDLDLLPPVLRELAAQLGVAPITRLVEAHGGTRIYVPHAVDEEHRLVAVLGLAPARALCAALGGDYLDVPRCLRAAKHLRDQALIRDARAGMTQRELALKYGMTERNVRLLWRAAGLEVDDRQAELF